MRRLRMGRYPSMARPSARSSPARRRSAEELLLRIARSPLAARTAEALARRCGIAPTAGRIVVGVSGGPDSMALLAMLAALHARGGRAPEPVAVTIHHGLRDEADEECALVARFARLLGVACERCDLRLERGADLSARARTARYAALAESAGRWQASAVATGHHAEDRLETLLLAIGRGRGLRGVAAPRWSRSLAPGVRLVRPLLETTKAECAALLDACDIAYAEDPSNLDPTRGRGHLRRAVLPHIVARWPHAARNASFAIDEAILARAALERSVARRFGPARTPRWRRERFLGCDVELAAWALRRACFAADPRTAESIGRASWRRAAAAAVDEARSPRVFRWGRLTLRVGADEIAITESSR